MITLVAKFKDRVIKFPLADDATEVTAGSLPDNAIYLPYKGISRRHFSLTRDANYWILRDLGSTNGISVNGKKVFQILVQPGDKIQAGIVDLEMISEEAELEPIRFVPLEQEYYDRSKTDRIDTEIPESTAEVFSFPGLVLPEGFILEKSDIMIDIYDRLHSILESDVSVMFVGETGTGKEMFAKLLHLSGPRSSGPFVPVNCAAIPVDLMEAELFGIGERVATNVNQRKGKIAAADGGSLFLDEVSSFPYDLQSKILRAVEERAVSPVGEHRTIPVDFRLLSATNQDPQELIATKRLREDLYHRLATVEIVLPPLRDRKEDLEAMIVALLRQFAGKERKTFAGISKRLMAFLLSYSYPGNLRELVNLVRAMVALAHPGEILDIHLLPDRLVEAAPANGSSEYPEGELPGFQTEPFALTDAVDAFTRKLIMDALDFHQGNVRKAAEHLKVTPFGLRKMMKRLRIEKQP